MTRNGEYIQQVMSGQGETLDSLTSMIDVLGDKLKGSSSACMDLVEKLSALDSLIDDEKRKWIVQVGRGTVCTLRAALLLVVCRVVMSFLGPHSLTSLAPSPRSFHLLF
jgi:hypothetical protein